MTLVDLLCLGKAKGWRGVSAGNSVVAAAILDRLMHRAIVFNIKAPSWHMREHQALATASSTPFSKDKEGPLAGSGLS